jgi:hypothetical protein
MSDGGKGGGGVAVVSSEIVAFVFVVALLSAFLRGLSDRLGGNTDGWGNAFLDFLVSSANMIATIIVMIAIAIAVYAYMRIGEISKEETQKLGLALNWDRERIQKNERWTRVETYMQSLNPSDWKIAILEADNILDQVVERMGYQGKTLADRMKNIESSDFPYLDDARAAHKTRNQIAHSGLDYTLARSDAERLINTYYRIFKELGYL